MQSRFIRTDSKSRRDSAVRMACEELERRVLLTSTLYIDYGDSFPGGVLTTTVGALKNTTSGSNPNVDGPQLTDKNGNNYPDGTTMTITSLNTLYGAGAAALRSTMDALVRRFYQPLNITVVDLTGSAQTVNGHSVQAATSLNAVSSTLGANNADAQHNDSYIIVGEYQIGATNDNPAVFAKNGYGGISNGADIGGNNNTEGTGCVMLIGAGDSAQFNGDQIAHESGHLFGMVHSFGNNPATPPGGSGIDAILPQSDMMSYLAYTTNGGYDFFSRFPMVKGDGNTSNGTINVSPTEYDHMANDPNIGAAPLEYVTGTGANNLITITKSATPDQANVSVQAFDDTAYTQAITVPGTSGTTFSYTIPLDNPLLVDAGGGSDRVTIDGDLGIQVTVRGMSGTDQLVVNGKGAASAVYTAGTNTTPGLDGNTDLRGAVSIGSTTINFQEFEAAGNVTVNNVGSLTFRTPLPTNTLTVGTPSAGQEQVSGNSNGVPLVPLDFTSVANLTVDTATNDGGGGAGDNVTVSASAPATGLSTFAIRTGGGNDSVTVNFASGNAIPSGGMSDTADGGFDVLNLKNGAGFTNEVSTPTGPGSGSISLDSSTITYSGLSPINDTVPVTNFTINGTAGPDVINTVNGPIVAGFQTTQVNSGSATFELVNFANKSNVTVSGQSGGDSFTLNNPNPGAGLNKFTYQGGAAGDTMNVIAEAVKTNLVGGGPSTVTVGNAGSVQNITGTLNIENPPAFNSITIDDSNDPTGRNVTLSTFAPNPDDSEGVSDPWGKISGLSASADINYEYNDTSSIVINTSAGNDTVSVRATGPGVSTQINLGGGNDSISVGNLFNSLNDIQGSLTVNGNGGTDDLTLNDQGDPVAHTYDINSTTVSRSFAAPITYGTLESLTLNAGHGNNTITINGTAAGVNTTANGNDGNDTFTIVGAGGGVGSVINANGAAGDDIFNVTASANAPINVDGGTHVAGDTLNFDGQLLTYVLNGNSFTGTLQPVIYQNVQTITLTNGTFNTTGTISPAVVVNNAATLAGSGNILGPVTSNVGGTVAPGVGAGNTAIIDTGNLTLNASSTYSVDINGATAGTLYDQLKVTGNVVLNNPTLTGTVGYSSLPGDEIVIIDNPGAGTVTGTFLGLPQGALITLGGKQFTIDYTFDAEGDTQYNDVALIRYGAQLGPDPCDPTEQALFVSATAGPDNIQVVPYTGHSSMQVFINGMNLGVFAPTGHLIVFGQAGNDLINVTVPAESAFLYGGTGDDTIHSGSGDSVLMGGDGNDSLVAGNGKDILIGGRGNDSLDGGNAGDILIAGRTSYDTNSQANRAALCGIMDEWSHGNAATSVNFILHGGGLNGTAVFNATTVFNDASPDTLLGGNGKDWFITNTFGNDITDATRQEIVTMI